eukprot:c42654_g1_i1 orf=153-320(+)
MGTYMCLFGWFRQQQCVLFCLKGRTCLSSSDIEVQLHTRANLCIGVHVCLRVCVC